MLVAESVAPIVSEPDIKATLRQEEGWRDLGLVHDPNHHVHDEGVLE